MAFPIAWLFDSVCTAVAERSRTNKKRYWTTYGNRPTLFSINQAHYMNLRKMEKFITHMMAYLKCLLTFCFYRNWLGRNCLLYLDIETESAFSTKPKPVSTNGSRP